MSGVVALLIWGTLVGLDLVSVPQIMIARPLVAGAVAGALLGDVTTGLLVGMLFELFQYDVLPVGAVRYPEYGPATVAAAAAAHGAAAPASIALAAVVGLVTALVGGLSLGLVRRLNTVAVRASAAALDSGEPRALLRVHRMALARDALRALAVTALGLGLAWTTRAVLAELLSPTAAVVVAVAAGAAAVAAAASGVLRLVGRGPELRWLAGGVAAGALLAWVA